MRFVRIAVAFISSAIVGAVCVLIVFAASDGVNFRSLKSYVILSGSMEPKLPLGSIVVTRAESQYSVGDIITFIPTPNNKIPVTHRVTKVNRTNTQNNLLYETKGDKNNAVDAGSIKQDQIIGKVFFYVPYIGYVAQAAKTQKGFIFLIIVPSTIIIYEELKTLKKELTNLLKKLKSNKTNDRALIFVPMIASLFIFTSYSRSFFSDKETSSNNSFQAGAWTITGPGTTLTPTLTPIPTETEEQPSEPTVIPSPTPTSTSILTPTQTPTPNVPLWINEIHYDNVGTDTNEGIEIAGPAGTDLTGWTIVLYNGSMGGTSYNTLNLSGIIPDQQGGYGTLWIGLPTNGLQNGDPADGLALVTPSSTVVQFSSYEGVLTASNGPASGMTSVDIGVAEINTTPIGFSLQLQGSGNEYADFVWVGPIAKTDGAINTGQTFN